MPTKVVALRGPLSAVRMVAQLRKWRIVALVGAMVLALIGGSASAWADDTSPSPSPTGSISGVVTTDTGVPAEGVQVIASIFQPPWTWSEQAWTTVAADGSYTLSNLPDGDYRLDFRRGSAATDVVEQYWRDAGYLWDATSIPVSGGAAVTGIDPTMRTAGSISGTVTTTDGAAAVGVSVSASDPATGATGGWAYVDPSGNYRMTGVKPGIYRIQFQPGYMNPSLAGQWWNDAPSRSKASVITVTAGQETSGVGALMSAAGSITGVVTSDKGAPAPNVNVSFYHADGTAYGEFAGSTSTDANGEYSFGGLPADSYKIQFSPSGSLLGEWYDNAQDSERATPLVLDAGASATADAVLTTGATVSGVVTDRGGRPVENAFVLVQSVAGSGLDYAMGGYSGSDGAYSVTGLPPGMYKVQFRTDQALQNVAPAWWKSADRESKAKPLTLSAGGVTTDIDARLDAGASISGIVRDGANGPVPYAWITAFNDAGEQVAGTSVAQDGSFRLNGLAPGSYRLQFVGEADGTGMLEWWKGAGTIAAASAIAVKAGDNIAGLDVDLSRAGGGVLNTWNESLSGVVTDGLGNPLPGVVVEARSESMGDTAVSDADGVWKLPSLMPGTYRVSFTGDVGGARVTEWWNRAASAASATPLTLADGQHRTDINASLGAGALPAIPSSQPKITGPAHVGAVLKANPGSWTNGTQFTYQWYADGSPIGGETGASLAITPDLVHKQVTVLVTGSLAGYQSVSRSSAPTDPIPVP